MNKRKIILVNLVVLLVMVEILLQIFPIANRYNPRVIQSTSVIYDVNEAVGYAPIPNQTITIDNLWGTYSPDYQLNQYGYRDDSISPDKPENVQRILVLGGSSVFDIGATTGQDWVTLLENDLNATSDEAQFEVINAGVPGYTSYHSMNRLISEAWMFDPDYVLLYQCWNDIKYFNEVSPEQSYAMTQTKDMTELWDSYNDITFVNPLDAFLGYSQIYLLLRRGINPQTFSAEGRFFTTELRDSYNDTALQQFSYNVQNIVNFSRTIGAEPILIQQGRLVTSTNTEAERENIKYEFVGLSHEALVNAFADCDNVLQEIATTYDVPIIAETDAMNGDLTMFADHVHTTPLGSQTLAEIIATQLQQILNN